MVYFMLNRIRLLLPAVLLALGCQGAAASTWTFASGGSYYVTSGSSYGNKVTFYEGTEKLRTFAWSNTAETPVDGFEPAYIRRFSTGLGVCNRDEGVITDCVSGSIDHQVDNVSQQDVVLFLFESPQAMQSLTIDPWGTWDRDISFWVGTVSPTISLTGSTFGTLAALGFSTQMNSLNGAGDAALTIGLGGLVGNALLVGALNPADGTPDRFKIRRSSQRRLRSCRCRPPPGCSCLRWARSPACAGWPDYRGADARHAAQLPLGPEADGLRHMAAADRVAPGQVGQRARHAANPVLGPGRQGEPAAGGFEQGLARGVKRAVAPAGPAPATAHSGSRCAGAGAPPRRPPAPGRAPRTPGSRRCRAAGRPGSR